jgi:hypothetical protein
MPHDLMLRCEARREYLVNRKHEWRWKEVAVAETADAAVNDVRCMHCHGAVRIRLCSRYVLMSCFPSPETTKRSGLTPSLNHSHSRIQAV